jgi:hypothetical protein
LVSYQIFKIFSIQTLGRIGKALHLLDTFAFSLIGERLFWFGRGSHEAARLKSDHMDALMALAEIHAVIFDYRKTALKYYEKAIEGVADPTVHEKMAGRTQMLRGN